MKKAIITLLLIIFFHSIGSSTSYSRTWTFETVVPGDISSWAMDSSGNFHVATDAETGSNEDVAIIHTTNSSGSWMEEQVAVIPSDYFFYLYTADISIFVGLHPKLYQEINKI